jgi:carbon storage regulator
MLVLSRRLGEEIVIDNDIRVTVVAIKGGMIRLGVTAPKCITVDRAEVHERRDEFLTEAPCYPPAMRPKVCKLHA